MDGWGIDAGRWCVCGVIMGDTATGARTTSAWARGNAGVPWDGARLAVLRLCHRLQLADPQRLQLEQRRARRQLQVEHALREGAAEPRSLYKGGGVGIGGRAGLTYAYGAALCNAAQLL